MVARAEAAAATGERILDAFIELFWERISDQVTLEEVAARAGVTVQTVIRRFGNREGVFAAAIEKESARVGDQRSQASPGDVAGAVAVLVEHYEEMGGSAMRLLAEEGRSAAVDSVIEGARAIHRAWCEQIFEPVLTPLSGVRRRRRFAQFVAICDVYTWKLLRRDAGLSRAQTERAIAEMLVPFMTEES